ncbi:hypothetical protein [Rhodopseudomonas sp. B29]|uniref:hypothetical protein n=1 Tax=Rhodopseudomonas sp. B29 TaxID=95607 RepID=UPI001FCB5207|nr:hypothetical protein [Rhodopseudomonas sp. B29]
MLLPGAALSQTAQLAPADTPPPAAAPAPQPRENSGLVNEIEKLIKNPSSILPDLKLGSDDKPPAAPAPAPQVTPPAPPPPPVAAPAPSPPAPPASSTSLVPGLVTGRQPCPATGNGDDCKAAADTLCKAKGYRGGRSLGVDATEKCSAKLLIPGRARQPGDCKTENYVTRAWCQ